MNLILIDVDTHALISILAPSKANANHDTRTTRRLISYGKRRQRSTSQPESEPMSVTESNSITAPASKSAKSSSAAALGEPEASTSKATSSHNSATTTRENPATKKAKKN